MNAFRKLIYALLALAALTLIGTIGFHLIEGWSWFDSLYMVITTFATVGYREVHDLSQAGRVFNVFLIIGGVGLVFFAIGALTQALLEFELGNYFGRRRMERDIERLTGHYIICGAGRVGRSAARELAGKPASFLVVDAAEARLQKLDPAWLTLQGDATQESVLRLAGIGRAAGLVAATTTDATNIYIVLTARGLNPKLTIIARASEEDAGKHLLKAGADSIVSPYVFAGHRIAQAFLRPNVLSFLDVATSRTDGLDLAIEEFVVDDSSPLAGQTLEGSQIRQNIGVVVLAFKSANGAMKFNPAPEDRITPGCHLIVMGQPAALKKLEAAVARG